MTQLESFDCDKFMAGSEKKPELSAERFELISAYIDNELSPTERKQVQNWLDCEPQTKQLYTQLLALQGQMQSLEVPQSNCEPDKITASVFRTLDRRRYKRRLILGGGAIAASVLAGFTGLVSGVDSDLKLAQSVDSEQNMTDTVMLAIALNKPAIDIPKPLNGYVEQPEVED